MTDFLTFMAAPLIGCAILSVVYTWFGCHVLKREIIFVDIAMAQLAALGTTAAFILRIDLDSPLSLGMSLACILAGGAFFVYTNRLSGRVPQEAVIGIVYVVGASAALLLAGRAPHGAEHLKALLNGSILWLTWPGVLKLLLVSALVAIPHFIYRQKFQALSESYSNPEQAARTKDPLWDLLFYVSLGLVIVFSVRTAGIFLIFTLLIIPGVCGALFTRSLVKQFALGSILGVSVSFAGLVLSFYLDLPTGATLVCTFGVTFFLALIISRVTA